MINVLHKLDARQRAPTGPIFASIGTVLIDCFDVPPVPSLNTQTPACTRPSSPSPSSRSSRSLASSLSSLSLSARLPLSSSARSSGTLTPQRGFDSDDTSPSTCSSSGQSSLSGSTCLSSNSGGSLAQIEEEPVEVFGGGALYSVVGARMWLPASECTALVDTDDERRDLSKDQEEELAQYGAACWAYLEGEGRRMIKARIRYEGTVRLYKHIVPPIPRPFPSLLKTPIDGAHYLHISPPYSPVDLCRLLAQQRALEAETGEQTWRPKIVYEPAPLGCHAGQKDYLEESLQYLEVISPNHEELLSLYGRQIPSLSSPLLIPALEEVIAHMLDLGVGAEGAGSVVVRCGRLGSVVGTRSRGIKWYPAYWEDETEGKVKDVTGGGNAYLGGFIAGLSASGGDPYEAALYGTVSASFTVEQIGLPTLSHILTKSPSHSPNIDGHGASGDGGELRRSDIVGERWNGEVPERRLELFRWRVAELALAERPEGGGD